MHSMDVICSHSIDLIGMLPTLVQYQEELHCLFELRNTQLTVEGENLGRAVGICGRSRTGTKDSGDDASKLRRTSGAEAGV
jgi:hypothetical protein